MSYPETGHQSIAAVRTSEPRPADVPLGHIQLERTSLFQAAFHAAVERAVHIGPSN
jgi:hypothetical protein